ncbi:sel1 repeat family protein, partial [Novosphingobium sp. 1949]
MPSPALSATGASRTPATSAADTVKAGVDAWSQGDFAGAVARWKPLADKGDPDAQFNLAQAYKLGRGVPIDLARAKTLYGEAAAKGHVQAADNYGLLLFQDGERAKAMPYIEASAARGDARAQYILGIAHFNGDLAAKDWVRAYALVTLARRAELPQATTALAQMDSYIPLAQRQEAVALATQLAAQADANRTQLAAASELETRGGPPPVLTPSGLAAAAA